MNMPKGLQILKMKDELRRAGVSPDLVDVSAHIDASLTYGENYQNIMGRYKGMKASRTARKRTQSSFGGMNLDFKYASQYHAARSPRSRASDEARRNKRTYSEREISKKPSLLDDWYRRPGSMDIFPIDTPVNFTQKKKGKRR